MGGDDGDAWSLRDAALVRSAREGDRSAFGALHARYVRAVHGVLLARAPWQEVDDLAQEVFMTALRRLHTLRDDAAFGGWLLAIARSHSASAWRRPKLEELPADLALRPDRGAEAREALAAVRRLPEAYRETLVLRLVEGLTGPEIAERTGLTEGSVRVNLHRGMKLLRERMAGTEAPR